MTPNKYCDIFINDDINYNDMSTDLIKLAVKLDNVSKELEMPNFKYIFLISILSCVVDSTEIDSAVSDSTKIGFIASDDAEGE